MSVIAVVKGELLAIDPMKEVIIDKKPLKIGRAIFLISFGNMSKMATMIFWEEETNQLFNLQLGKKYGFTVGLETNGDVFFLYFLSQLTIFKEEKVGD